jgi:hypothetical protein
LAQDASAPIVSSDVAPALAASRIGTNAIVHNEAAFRHFLAIERRRAERAGRTVVLVLVSLRGTAGRSERLPQPVARGILSALGSSVREVDFVGWFRDGQVAAAALIQRGRPQPAMVTARINDTLKRDLRESAANLRLRVVLLGAQAGSQ